MNYHVFLDGDSIITNKNGTSTNQTSAQTGTGTGTETTTAAPVPSTGGTTGLITIVFYFILIGGVFYFLMIRPQRKRDKQMKELQSNIRPGDPVVLSSGMFGKVVDVGDDVFVVELGMTKGIKIPVRKSDVLAVKEPKLTAKKSESEVIEDKKDKKED